MPESILTQLTAAQQKSQDLIYARTAAAKAWDDVLAFFVGLQDAHDLGFISSEFGGVIASYVHGKAKIAN